MASKGSVKVTVKKSPSKKPILPKTGVGQVGLLTQPIIATIKKKKNSNNSTETKKNG